MQAFQGYLSDGRFTPTDKIALPRHAKVRLIIEEIIEKNQTAESPSFRLSEAEKQARIESLKKIKADLELIDDEDLSDFPRQGLMKLPQDYAWFD